MTQEHNTGCNKLSKLTARTCKTYLLPTVLLCGSPEYISCIPLVLLICQGVVVFLVLAESHLAIQLECPDICI